MRTGRAADIDRALTGAEKPSEYFVRLRETGSLGGMLRELSALIGVPQNPEYHPEGDAWNHTMLVIDEAARLKESAEEPRCFMYAALCHDFGKAVTTTETDGRIRSIGHERAGIPLTAAFLRRMGLRNDEREYIINLVKLHMRPHALTAQNSGSRAFARLFGEAICPGDLVLLAKADRMGQLKEKNMAEELRLRAELENWLENKK